MVLNHDFPMAAIVLVATARLTIFFFLIDSLTIFNYTERHGNGCLTLCKLWFGCFLSNHVSFFFFFSQEFTYI